MSFTFSATVAYDPVSKQPVKSVSFQVFALTDTAFTTPLAITDRYGTPYPGNILNSGTQGVFPEFQHATNSAVTIADATKTYAWTIPRVLQDTAVAGFAADPASATGTQLNATYASYVQLAKNPDTLIAGAVTVDGSDLVTSAAVVWPNGQPGTLTITSRDATGAVLAYNITYGSPITKTFTQPTITRNANGAATNVPQIVVT